MIIDSSALLAIIMSEPEEAAFAMLVLEAGAPKMSAASYVEVAMVLDGKQAAADPQLDLALSRLGIQLVEFSTEQARAARDAFNIYGRGRHPAKLNFGDCMTYALAKVTGEPLLFKGNDFAQTDLLLIEASV